MQFHMKSRNQVLFVTAVWNNDYIYYSISTFVRRTPFIVAIMKYIHQIIYTLQVAIFIILQKTACIMCVAIIKAFRLQVEAAVCSFYKQHTVVLCTVPVLTQTWTHSALCIFTVAVFCFHWGRFWSSLKLYNTEVMCDDVISFVTCIPVWYSSRCPPGVVRRHMILLEATLSPPTIYI